MCLCGVKAFGAMTADQVMAKVSAALTQPKSVSVTFSFSGAGGSGNGAMTVCKQMFTYVAGDIAVWYDGKTQWVRQNSAKEISITEPTAAELVESNPFRVITGYKNLYTCKLLPAPAGTYMVQLTARSKANAVRSAVVTVNAKTFIPNSITATMDGGLSTITISSFKPGAALSAASFRITKAHTNGYELNDLR